MLDQGGAPAASLRPSFPLLVERLRGLCSRCVGMLVGRASRRFTVVAMSKAAPATMEHAADGSSTNAGSHGLPGHLCALPPLRCRWHLLLAASTRASACCGWVRRGALACRKAERFVWTQAAAAAALFNAHGHSFRRQGPPGWPAQRSSPGSNRLQQTLAPSRACCLPPACRAGWVTNFLSHAQVSGFMTGAAILIGLSQVGCQADHVVFQFACCVLVTGACSAGCPELGSMCACYCACHWPYAQPPLRPALADHLPTGPPLTPLPASPPRQVKYILGLTVPRTDRIQDYLQVIFDNLWQFKCAPP